MQAFCKRQNANLPVGVWGIPSNPVHCFLSIHHRPWTIVWHIKSGKFAFSSTSTQNAPSVFIFILVSMYDLYVTMRAKKVNNDIINSQAEFCLAGFFFEGESRRTYQELWETCAAGLRRLRRRAWTLFWVFLSWQIKWTSPWSPEQHFSCLCMSAHTTFSIFPCVRYRK